ncbi:hypothetical protein CVIRNUC_005514 [Coccomyxa viridis]|uniref:Uncharacterized protein n=1 Tax=Coccomyxa viridis TaxID=1274662 RepID=A0AAV1I736_9CHLO|nr:hypothetical protein CVIRNUC_005514 [Coccomyxa viridis]
MCATFPATETLSENATVLVAFNTLALVCKNTQVMKLTCHETIALPLFAGLKHLILSTASSADVPITTLKNAVALETLSLGIFEEYADWSQKDIDVSHLHALKHMLYQQADWTGHPRGLLSWDSPWLRSKE